mmetsp:Transcript_33533/g.73381  ORF Transcript_33533/g.73381 Transcript_33533/m.73381 type:complete len:249 (+) Transcript_33533:548-1294(+)
MLQIFEGFFVNLRVQDVMHSIHLGLPVLLVHIPLLLEFPRGVAVFLDIYLMGSALHRETIGLLPQFQDISFVFTEAALHTAHAEIQSAEAPRCLSAPKLCLLLHRADFFKGLLLLLPDVVLESGLGVSHVPLQVAPDHGHFIEAVAQRVLRRVEALLRRCQILVCEVDAPIQSIHSLICVTSDLGLRLFEVCLHCSDVVPNSCQDLINFSPAGINIQPQRRHHVPHSLDGSIEVVIRLFPCHVIDLGV